MRNTDRLEDEHYILYEKGKGTKKISIKDIRELVMSGKMGALLTDLEATPYEVYRVPQCIKPEYKEILANYMIDRRLDTYEIKAISELNREEVMKYMREHRLI